MAFQSQYAGAQIEAALGVIVESVEEFGTFAEAEAVRAAEFAASEADRELVFAAGEEDRNAAAGIAVAARDAALTAQAAAEAASSAAQTAEQNAAAYLDQMQTTYQTIVNTIGTPGAAGFGVGIAPAAALFAGMTPLYGYTDPTHPNYGNYQFSDGSIMCWVPKFYYRIGHASNPTFAAHGVNSVDVKGVKTFPTRFEAEAQGYVLHRAFVDGGVVQDGFYYDKFQASRNALGSGFVASSLAGGNPLSTAADHNPLTGLTACSANNYSEVIKAAKARDGINGAVNATSRFFCASRFQWAALALLSLAHGQAATATTYCAWYSAGATNFPKGNNNNALKDSDDTAVTYTSDGYPNCGKTGSGVPLAKTTHNGQACGIADLNGNMWEISLGITCIAATKSITAITQGNPCQITAAAHGLTTGQAVMILAVGGMTQLNDKVFTVTVVDVNNFRLNVDSSAFGAYTSGGTATAGTFYAAKESTRMRDFTSGTTLATDHWGATGVAARMEPLAWPLRSDYPNNGFALRFGSGAERVLSADVAGAGRVLTGLGLPRQGLALSAAGTNLFGADYHYQYVRLDMCLLSAGNWYDGSSAGVWALYALDSRTTSNSTVGFRAACYPGA